MTSSEVKTKQVNGLIALIKAKCKNLSDGEKLEFLNSIKTIHLEHLTQNKIAEIYKSLKSSEQEEYVEWLSFEIDMLVFFNKEKGFLDLFT